MAEIVTFVRQDDRHHEHAAAAVEIEAQFGQFLIDVANWTITWSPGIAAIFGRPMPASGVLDLDEHFACYHPDDAAADARSLRAAAAGPYQNGPFRHQGRVLRPDGMVRHVMVKGIGRSDGHGHLASIAGMLIDVTEMVEAECAAQEDGRRLQATLDVMDQGIVMVDAGLRVSVVNEQMKHVLGLPPHLARAGVRFPEILRFQEENGEFVDLSDAARAELAIEAGGLATRSCTRQRPNGTVLEVHTAPLPDGGYVRTYRDVTERHLREAALAESEQRFRLIAETTSDVIMLWDEAMRRRYVSPSVTALLGYQPHEQIGSCTTDLLHEDDVEGYAAELAALVIHPSGKGRTRRRYRRKDGSHVWVDLSITPIDPSAASHIGGYVAVLRDASAQVEAEESLRLNEQRLAFALESGGDGVWSYDSGRDHVVLEGRWWSILGYQPDEIAPTQAGWDALTHPDDRARVREAMIEHMKGKTEAIKVEYRIRAKSGDYIWTLARDKVAERLSDGRAALLIGTHQDITHRKSQEQSIARLALHDALTRLPNRLFFRDTVEQVIGTAWQAGCIYAMLACDLDRFKAVNDTLGHAAGDELLCIVAARLLAVVRGDDTVARVGGDEFLILLDGLAAEDDAVAAAQRIIAAVAQPIVIGGRQARDRRQHRDRPRSQRVRQLRRTLPPRRRGDVRRQSLRQGYLLRPPARHGSLVLVACQPCSHR